MSNWANPVGALGQYDQTSYSAPVGNFNKGPANDGSNRFGFSGPGGMAFDTVHHRFFAMDAGANRILVYDLANDQTFDDRLPDHVLGQGSFSFYGSATSQSRLRSPNDVAYDSVHDRLFVSDAANNRVLVFDTATIADGENAVNVLGQSDYISSAT